MQPSAFFNISLGNYTLAIGAGQAKVGFDAAILMNRATELFSLDAFVCISRLHLCIRHQV
jgi:hypothetical protein